MLCLVTQSCPTLCDRMDMPGYSVNGDSPGKNTGVGCHTLFQGIFPTQGSNQGLLHCRQILYQLRVIREAPVQCCLRSFSLACLPCLGWGLDLGSTTALPLGPWAFWRGFTWPKPPSWTPRLHFTFFLWAPAKLRLTLQGMRSENLLGNCGQWGFPGRPVVETLPSNAGDAGSIPVWGAKITHVSCPKQNKHETEAVL